MTDNTFNGYESYNQMEHRCCGLTMTSVFTTCSRTKLSWLSTWLAQSLKLYTRSFVNCQSKRQTASTWEADTILDLVTEHYDEQLQYS